MCKHKSTSTITVRRLPFVSRPRSMWVRRTPTHALDHNVLCRLAKIFPSHVSRSNSVKACIMIGQNARPRSPPLSCYDYTLVFLFLTNVRHPKQLLSRRGLVNTTYGISGFAVGGTRVLTFTDTAMAARLFRPTYIYCELDIVCLCVCVSAPFDIWSRPDAEPRKTTQYLCATKDHD